MTSLTASSLGHRVFYNVFAIISVAVLSAGRRADVTRASFDDVALCPAPNRYLDEAFRCRADVFESSVHCEGDNIRLRCPQGRYLAVRSAVFGFSLSLRADSSCAPTSSFGQPAAATNLDRSCAARCVLQIANHLCHGKRHCQLTANTETFDHRCRPGATKYFGIVYMCISRNTSRLLDSRDANDNEEFIQTGCTGSEYISGGGRFGELSVSLPTSTTVTTTSPTTTTTTVASTTPSTTTRPTTPSTSAATTSSTSFYVGNRRNIDRAAADEQQQSNWDRWTTTTQFYQQRYPAVRTVLPQPNYPVLDDDDSISVSDTSLDDEPPQHGGVLQGASTKHHSPSLWIYPLADWIWTYQFANENKEKFVLYMSLGLSVGTIAVLTAVIFYFIVQHHHHRDTSLDSATNGTSRRAKPGRSNTNDLMSGLHSGTIGSSCASPSWHDAMGPTVGSASGGGGVNHPVSGRPPTHFHESESSTGDDRTLNDPDDVDMPSFNHHVDSLPRRCSAATQPLSHQLSSNGASATTSAGIMMTSSTLGNANAAAKCPHHSMQQQQQQQPPPPPPQQLGTVGLGSSSMVTRPGSSLGGPLVTTTATINRSYNPVHAPVSSAARCLTPATLPTTSITASPPPPAPAPICNGGTMTLGHVPNGYGVRYAGYQIGGGGGGVGGIGGQGATTSSSGNGPGMTSVPSRGPMIGSLGRSFSTSAASNQYGMDIGAYHHQPSQHSAHYHNNHVHQYDHGLPPGHNHHDIGSRTLGPSMQHYYG